MGQHLRSVTHDEPRVMAKGRWHVANLHPALSFPAQVLNFFGPQVLGSHHRSRTVILLDPFICDQPSLAEMLGHGCTRIRRGVLDVWPIYIAARECEVGLNRLLSVVRITDNQPSHNVHSVSMQALD